VNVGVKEKAPPFEERSHVPRIASPFQIPVNLQIKIREEIEICHCIDVEVARLRKMIEQSLTTPHDGPDDPILIYNLKYEFFIANKTED